MENNIFDQEDRERQGERDKWGLGDLDDTSYLRVRMTAFEYFRKHNIIDDDEKRNIYDQIKQQYLEYNRGYIAKEKEKYEQEIIHLEHIQAKTEEEYPSLHIYYRERYGCFVGNFSDIRLLGQTDDLEVQGNSYIECAEKATKMLEIIKQETEGIGKRIKERLEHE